MAKHGETPGRSSAQASARRSDGSLRAIHLSHAIQLGRATSKDRPLVAGNLLRWVVETMTSGRDGVPLPNAPLIAEERTAK
jgi:hypothetical protein